MIFIYDTTKPYTEIIKSMRYLTWNTPFVSVNEELYPVVREKIPILVPRVDHPDGIGTKGHYHWMRKTFGSAAIDAMAMNLNDLTMARAIPYKMQDHIFVPDESGILELFGGLCTECIKRNIAITGGETSVHDNMDGLDVSIVMSGFVLDNRKNKIHEGDYLVGLPSNGLHSNGFTKVREVFGDQIRGEFTEPTRIYDEVSDIRDHYDVNGMMHITGGAFTKMKHILDGCDAEIIDEHKLKPHKIFQELFERGVSDEEMYRTFNCGIGFLLSASEADAESITQEYPEADIIGRAVPGKGKIRVESYFTGDLIEY